MPSAGSAWIDIQPKLDDFGRRLSQQLSPALERFGRGAVAAGTTLSKYVTAPVVAFGVAAVKAFDEAARADAQTAAVLRSTGGIAHVTAGHVRELAGTIRDYSGVEDEAVQGAENLLLTFVRIRDEAGRGNDVFDQATRVVVDMSQALGQDLRSSAIQVGKALNDPVRGMTALRRVGVQLTDQQERQIKQLVAEGKLRAAQKVILGELTREFGGVAEAMGKTSSAKLQIAMSHLGDSMERVGGIIAPLIERLASFANALARWFDALAPSGQRLVVTILAVAAAVGPALVVVGKLAMGFASVGRAFGALSGLLAANPYVAIIAATIALVVLIVANWGRIRAFLAGAWEVSTFTLTRRGAFTLSPTLGSGRFYSIAPPSAPQRGDNRPSMARARWSAEGRPSPEATTMARGPRRIRTSHTRPAGRVSSAIGSWSTSTVRRARAPRAARRHSGEQYRGGRPRPPRRSGSWHP